HKDLGGDKEVSLPLSCVVLIWRLVPDRTVGPEKLRHRLARAARARDVIHLRNGDTLEGTLNRLGAGTVEAEVHRKKLSANWAQVAAIALSTELADKLQPKGPHARLVVAPAKDSPGGRFTLTQAECDGEELRGKTVFGAELRVPVERVVAFDVLGDRVTHLSDLKPVKNEYFPYLNENWAPSADATVTGRDLVVGGSAYDRGVGMHAHSRLVYPLEGKYRRFEATVGLDDRDGRRGRVRLRVLVDGKEAEL